MADEAKTSNPKDKMAVGQVEDEAASTEKPLPFNLIVDCIMGSELCVKMDGFIKEICCMIAEMLVFGYEIEINHETMLLNVSKGSWSKSKLYGIQNLFTMKSAYCSKKDSGNCVDLTIDLKNEHTITKFLCKTLDWNAFSCAVTHAYLWVFGTKTLKMIENNVEKLEKLCKEKLYSKTKFEKALELDSQLLVLDAETRERKRDEMVPVAAIKFEKSTQLIETNVPSYVKGTYIMIKLVSSLELANQASNVDAQYVGIHGYRMN